MSTVTHPHLRLVGTEASPDQHEIRARHAVARENRAAAGNPGLEPTDPRWVLAVRAYAQLQGSALTYERRQRVMRTARAIGVRPFDASLIIAIVQDHARRGRELGQAAPTIALLERPAARRSAAWSWARWIAAVVCAVAANGLLIWWVTAS